MDPISQAAIAVARKRVTNTLDEVDTARYQEGFGVHFNSDATTPAVLLHVVGDTYTVDRQVTSRDDNFLEVADAYPRAATFIRRSGLKPR